MSSSTFEAPGAHPVIDAALRCDWADRETLYGYLPRAWRDYLPPRTRIAGVRPPWTNPVGNHLPEAQAGGAAPDLTAALGPDVERAVLLMEEGGFLPAIGAPHLARELVRAANAWLVDHWLSGADERLHGAALVSTHQPDAAAREIRRVGANPRIVAVHLRGNALGKGFGHPVYHPVYAAASGLGLPVVIEAGGDSITDALTHPTAGGPPMTFGELATLQACSLMTHIVSLVSQGVFRKYPDLKVMLLGGGLAWLPWLFWRADTEWKNIRREIPWVDVPPSEYFHDRVRFATTPLAHSDGTFDLAAALGTIPGVERLCCFASSYPRWNAERPADIVEAFPGEWHRAILHDNARDFFRWPSAG